MLMQLELDGWRRGFMFSACHMIPGHEKCGRLHGHTYTVNLKIDGDADESGMVLDFGNVKKVLKTVLEELDHKVLIPKDRPEFKIVKEGESVRVEVGDKFYIFPEEDIYFMDIPAPTAEHMAGWMLERFIEVLRPKSNVTEIALGLDEGWGQGAWVSKTL
jgi:6-pyruvoyltetrahydropterin/6-carboxytetrahydropterin synthase